jgi:FMN-dependent NADH-azoreductase
MEKILYIKASPMKKLSFSIAVTDAFIEKYLNTNPETNVEILELFDVELPDFNFTAASAKYKIMHGKDHSEQEKQRWQRIVEIIENFKSADKYVLAVPMWNFSIPYKLKHYLDIIIQPSLTFSTDQQGNYKTLIPDKPVFIAYARGGEFSDRKTKKSDMQKPYLESALNFIGLKSIQSVIIEPTLAKGKETAESKKAEAVEQAFKTAEEF